MRTSAWLTLALLLTLVSVQAHPILQNPVWIESSPERLTLKLDVSVRELVVVQGLPVASDGSVDIDEAAGSAEKHSGYLLDHFHCKADGKLLTGAVVQIKPPKEIISEPEGPDNAHFRYTINYPLSEPPAVLTFSQNMCVEFPSAPGVPWDLSYAYRYGREGETPVKFGALLRDREISFSSGFARADPKGGLQSGQGGESQAAPVLWRAETIAAIKEVQPGVWFALWLVFVAAVTLGATMRPLWYQLAAALWFGSYLVAPQIASMAPLWLRGLLSGATAILAAADIIHAHPASEAARHRRVILLLAGALFFGASLGQVQPGQMDSTRGWVALLLLSALALSAILTGLRVLSGPADSASRRICVQLAALACCGGGIFAMLRLLEVI